MAEDSGKNSLNFFDELIDPSKKRRRTPSSLPGARGPQSTMSKLARAAKQDSRAFTKPSIPIRPAIRAPGTNIALKNKALPVKSLPSPSKPGSSNNKNQSSPVGITGATQVLHPARVPNSSKSSVSTSKSEQLSPRKRPAEDLLPQPSKAVKISDPETARQTTMQAPARAPARGLGRTTQGYSVLKSKKR